MNLGPSSSPRLGMCAPLSMLVVLNVCSLPVFCQSCNRCCPFIETAQTFTTLFSPCCLDRQLDSCQRMPSSETLPSMTFSRCAVYSRSLSSLMCSFLQESKRSIVPEDAKTAILVLLLGMVKMRLDSANASTCLHTICVQRSLTYCQNQPRKLLKIRKRKPPSDLKEGITMLKQSKREKGKLSLRLTVGLLQRWGKKAV